MSDTINTWASNLRNTDSYKIIIESTPQYAEVSRILRPFLASLSCELCTTGSKSIPDITQLNFKVISGLKHNVTYAYNEISTNDGQICLLDNEISLYKLSEFSYMYQDVDILIFEILAARIHITNI